MNQKNELYELLDGIIECSEKVAKLGKLLREFLPQFLALLPDATAVTNTPSSPAALPAKKEASHEKQTVAAENTKKESVTIHFEEVRKACAAKSHAGFTTQVKELISKYGACRLSDVKETDYAALMADLEVIG